MNIFSFSYLHTYRIKCSQNHRMELNMNSEKREKRKKGESVRDERKRLRSEGKPYVNSKSVLVGGKTEPKEEVCTKYFFL